MPSLRLRRFFYYLYLLLFLITAPTVVLYTAGYRFDFRTTSLVKTGALSITSTPRGASVLLDADEKPTKTPSLLKNVIPGMHELTLTKAGYHDWKRQVEVRSRQTTLVEETILFLVAKPSNINIEDGVETAGASLASDSYVYIEAGTSWYEAWEVDPATLKRSLLDRVAISENLTAEQALRMSLYPALPSYQFTEQGKTVLMEKDGTGQATAVALLPNGAYRAIQEFGNLVLIMQEDGTRLLLIDAQTDEAPILLNTQATFFEWTDGVLIYGDAFEVHRYETEKGIDTLVTRSGNSILDAHSINAHTYLLTFEHEVIAYDISDTTRPVTTRLYQATQLKRAWLLEDKKTAIIAAQDTPDGMTIITLPLQD